MAELIVAVAELLGLAGIAARYRNHKPGPVFVSAWVACLAFALLGVLLGGSFTALMATWHPAVSLAVAFILLFAGSAFALFSGVNPGFSLTWRAISSYGISFFFGAACVVLLFHRVG